MKIQITPDQRPILRALIPISLKNNNTGRGNAFWATAKDRKSAEKTLRQLRLERKPFTKPVILHATRILGKGQRLIDADSILRGSAKELIDSLVAVGWFADDSPAHIAHVAGFQDAGSREHGPATLLEVYDVEESFSIPSSLGEWLRDDSAKEII